MKLKEHWINTEKENTKLYAVSSGNIKNPSIVFLHGFPDSHEVWLNQINTLSKKFHLVSFDLIGSGQSSPPPHKEIYKLENILKHIDLVIDKICPQKKVHLVGHDWGSILGWSFVFEPSYQKKILSWTSISGPHLPIIAHSAVKNLFTLSTVDQLVRSWYTYFFQVPFLPEFVMKAIAPSMYRIALKDSGVPKDSPYLKISSDQIIRNSINMVNLYRKNLFKAHKAPVPDSLKVPTQILIPLKDPFLQPKQFDIYQEYVTQLTLKKIDAGHWVQLSHPKWVTAEIASYIDSL